MLHASCRHPLCVMWHVLRDAKLQLTAAFPRDAIRLIVHCSAQHVDALSELIQRNSVRLGALLQLHSRIQRRDRRHPAAPPVSAWRGAPALVH